MTNPTQEIPAEEIQRIKNDAEYMYPDGSAHNSLMNFGYQNGAKAEYIRARRPIQLGNLQEKDQSGISQEWLKIWEQIEIWYGDPKKKESARQLLLRLQDQYSQQAQGETVCRFVKAIERLPSRNGDYNGRYNINRCVIDIRKGEIYELRGLAHIIPSDQVEIEYLEWLEEVPAQAQYTRDSRNDEDMWHPQDYSGKNAPAGDMPVSDEIKEWIDNNAECDADEDATLWINGALAMYRKLTESARKQPATMGKELRFSCNWANKACDEFIVCMKDDKDASYYTVLKGVFARLSFNEDLLDDRRMARQEAADYRKALTDVQTMAQGKSFRVYIREIWKIVEAVIDKYPSPPTK